jgi:hypothetical protein
LKNLKPSGAIYLSSYSYHERQKKIVQSSKNLQPKKFKPSKDIEHEGNREDGRYFEIDGG